MGGLGPGIGATELLLIGIIALLVVGPKDLPLLMRRVGQFMGKARSMAADFRASFDEMARQSELDDLRKEVEALRTGQMARPLGAETEATFRQISEDLNKPVVPTSYGASDPPAQPAPPAVPEPAETPPARSATAAATAKAPAPPRLQRRSPGPRLPRRPNLDLRRPPRLSLPATSPPPRPNPLRRRPRRRDREPP